MGARLVIRSIDGRRVEEEVGYPFDQARVVIGRARSAEVRIPHRTVSELHATLRHDGSGFSLCDEGSTNGTLVNDERLVPHRRKRLQDGDRVQIGVYLLSFHTGVLVTEPLSADRTAELARRLLREGRKGQPGAPPPPSLVIVSGPATGQTLSLGRPPASYLIGSAEHCQLTVSDSLVQEEQLLLTHDLDGARLRDTKGRPSIHVDNRSVIEHVLRDGDEFSLGETRILFEEPAHVRLEAAAAGDDEALPVDYRAAEPGDAQIQAASSADAEAAPVAKPSPSDLGTEGQMGPAAPQHMRSGKSSLGADAVIYSLAAAIVAISVAALVFLLRR